MSISVSQQAILAPVLATMLLTCVVWVYMYVRRIRFITRTRLSPGELAIPGTLARLSTVAVANPADNFRNLFEMPVLFYVLALTLMMTNRVDASYLGAAWVFVVFRVLHSAVHCTINIVMLRFYLYLISTLALWFMVGRAAVQQLALRG